MSVDYLQEKIRKMKNPSMLELNLSPAELPSGFCSDASGYCDFCQLLLDGLKGIMPAVRVSFASFALLGPDGLDALSQVLNHAKALGYYVVMDAPELLSPKSAAMTAEAVFGENSLFPCDGLIISGYLGSDVVKPFLNYCKDEKKDIFVVVRTANKSAPELQDLLSGGRIVHGAAADHVNRYGADTAGKFGYTRVGVLAAASSAESLRSLRMKYPRLFMILDGFDYPNSNAKNCSYAFDKFGHGAVASASVSITCAWKQEGAGEVEYITAAVSAAERMRKNLTRYITIL